MSLRGGASRRGNPVQGLRCKTKRLLTKNLAVCPDCFGRFTPSRERVFITELRNIYTLIDNIKRLINFHVSFITCVYLVRCTNREEL